MTCCFSECCSEGVFLIKQFRVRKLKTWICWKAEQQSLLNHTFHIIYKKKKKKKRTGHCTTLVVKHRRMLTIAKNILENQISVNTKGKGSSWLGFGFPYLSVVVWSGHYLHWDQWAESLCTRWFLGQGCHWQHRAWWLFECAPPLWVEGPCQC